MIRQWRTQREMMGRQWEVMTGDRAVADATMGNDGQAVGGDDRDQAVADTMGNDGRAAGGNDWPRS